MTVARVTQLGTQGVAQNDPGARVTREIIGAAVQAEADVRVTQGGVQLIATQEPAARLSNMFLQAIVRPKVERAPGRARSYQTSTTATKGLQGDPHWRNVVFLLNGEKGLMDVSRFRTVGIGDRRYGPILSNETPKWSKSIWCANAGTFGLRYYNDDPKRWDFGKGPFTIECWVRAPLAGGSRGIVCVYDTNNERSWALLLVNNVITFYASADGTAADVNLSGTTIAANTWTHICVERGKSGRIRMFVNGVMVSYVDYPGRLHRSNAPLCVGMYNTASWGSDGMIGYMDDIRVTKAARFDTNLGFEVPIAPYPFQAFAGHLSDQDEYWDLVTCLVNANQDPVVDLKRGAAVVVSRSSDWNEGTSGNPTLSGNGSIAHVDSQWDLGGRTEPFTLEFDAGYPSTSNGSPVIMTVANGWRYYVNRGGGALQYWNGSSWVTMLGSNNGWWWPHNLQTVCITRDEVGVWRMWVMGSLWDKNANVPVPATPNTDLTITVQDAVFDNLRMTWGVARYTSDSYIEDDRHALPYPLTGPAYVPPALPDPVYPRDLGFPDENGTFSSGDWYSLTGAVPYVVNKYQSAVPDTGEPDDFYRWMAGAATRVWNYTLMPIPKQFWDDVDAGGLFVETTGFGAATARQDDLGMIVTAATDAGGEVLRYSASTVGSAKEMGPLDSLMPVPPGSRAIRCGFLAYRPGSDGSFVYRKVKVRLLDEAPDQRVYLTKPSYPAQTDEWTDAKGGTISLVGANWVLSTPVTMGKTMDLRCVDDLPSSLLDEIDAGEAAFRFQTLLTYVDAGDFGRTYVEFLDDEAEVVGRRKWDAQVPYVPGIMQSVDIAVPIPVGARKVVMGVFGSKDYAETATNVPPNFHASLYNAYCYVPDPEDMPEPAPEPPVLDEDEHWGNVRFLLSTRNGVIENFADSDVRTLTAAGSVAVASIESPFGHTAINSNLAAAANSNDYIDVALFGPAIGPKMTFEGWFMKTGHTRTWTQFHNQLGNMGDSPNDPMRVCSISPYAQSEVQLAWNEWYHVALCRDDTGRGVCFINGKRQSRESGASVQQWLSTFTLGRAGTGSSEASWVGYFDEIRITDGVERYTEDFVPAEQRWPVGEVFAPVSPEDTEVEAAWGVADLAAIYSLRRTVPEYTGPLVRGVRLSDGAWEDFYPGDDEWLDVDAVEAWAEGSDVAVYRWYDQSSYGRHANSWEYSGGYWPLLASSGYVTVLKGVPYVRFGGADANNKTWMLLPFNVFKSPFTIVYAGQRTNNQGNGVWGALFAGALSSNGLGMGYAAALTPSLMNNGTADNTGGTAHPLNVSVINAWKADAAYAPSTTYSVTPYVNKEASSVRSLNYSTRTLTEDITYVGGSTNDASSFIGLISEIVIALSSLGDTDRQLIEDNMTLGAPAVYTDYTDPISVGSRASIIAVSLVNIGTAGGNLAGLVDGSQGNDWWYNQAVGDGTGWILFDLGGGGEKIIDGFRWYQHNAALSGTWSFEGSNDNAAWDVIGSPFTLGGQLTSDYWFGMNDQAYRYYRLRHLSGTRSSSPYYREIEFRVAPSSREAPAARYWRVFGTSPRGNYLSAGEIELRGTPGGPDLTGSGTAIESSHHQSFEASLAFDDNPSTFWESSSDNTNKWVGYDFGEDNDVAINEISFTTATSYADEVPTSLRVDFSHDGVTWSPMWVELDIPAWPLSEERVFTNPFHDPAPHTAPAARYWRIRGAAQGSNIMAVGELEFRAEPGGADLTGSGTPLSSSDYNSAHQKAYAFDNNPSNKWASTDTPFGKWIGYDFGDGNDVSVNEVAISARNDGALEQSPLRFWVEHSDDGVTWTKLWSVGSIPAWSLGETRVYSNPGYEE